MAVDTTIQFNGHNSYKVTELLLAYPFGVQGMTYITHSFQVYCNSPLASATRAKTKFFDADGATISDVSHAFAVPAVFEKVSITVPVPATAVQAQLVFLHGGTDWWFAEPKSEEGQSATPYNVNYAGQLTYITPNGVYTGMVTANQIVVTGSIAQPDETLETRLVTINNGVINLSSTLSAKTTKITNKGVYTGEVVAGQVVSGILKSANNYSWINLDDGKFSFGNGALAWGGSNLSVKGSLTTSYSNDTRVDVSGGKVQFWNDLGDLIGEIANYGYVDKQGLNINAGQNSKYLTLGGFTSGAGFLAKYYQNYGENPNGETERHIFVDNARFRGDVITGGDVIIGGSITCSTMKDINGISRLEIHNNGNTDIKDSNNIYRVSVLNSGDILLRDASEKTRLFISQEGQTIIRCGGATDNYILISPNVVQIVVNGVVKESWS